MRRPLRSGFASADSNVAYLLELRLRSRGNPEARAIVDRCLRLIAQAQSLTGPSPAELDDELARLADDLALRFGPPRTIAVQ